MPRSRSLGIRSIAPGHWYVEKKMSASEVVQRLVVNKW